MKAVQIVKPGDLRIIDVEKPVITETDNVLVKMTAVGICGSDMGIYSGENAAATYPRIIGHESVGVVEEVGPGVTAVKPGDRVIIDQVVNCGHCYPCRIGRGNVCDNLRVRGVHIDGSYREYMAVPESACYLLPEGLSDVDSVMIEPTTIGLQAAYRADLKKDDKLLIYGAGAIGMTVLRVAREYCDEIIVADIIDGKLEDALKEGATHVINSRTENFEEKVREYTDGRGPTVSIDAACLKTSMMTLMKVTGNAGRVVVMGFSTQPIDANLYLFCSKELDVRGMRLQNRMFGKAIDLVKSGKIDLKGSVSHTFPLTEAQKAFDFAMSGDPSMRKVVLTFDF